MSFRIKCVPGEQFLDKNYTKRYQISAHALDEYFYSALASAVIFRIEHPEFDTMVSWRAVGFSQRLLFQE